MPNKSDRDIRRQALIALIRRKKNRLSAKQILDATKDLKVIDDQVRTEAAQGLCPLCGRAANKSAQPVCAMPASTLNDFIKTDAVSTRTIDKPVFEVSTTIV